MNSILSNEFNRNVTKLVLGTGFAQIIPIALTPILTRIYSPEDFGIFAIYMAIASILGVIATARYELSIVLPKNDKNALDIFYLCNIVSFSLSFIFFIFIYIFTEELNIFIGLDSYSNILFLLPLSIIAAGLLQSLSYLLVRRKEFSSLSKSKIFLSGGYSSSQLTFGSIFSASGLNLSIGYISGQFFSIFYLIKKNWAFLKSRDFSTRRIYNIAKKYKKFPMYSSPGAIMDTSAVQVPIILINKFFNSNLTGQFSLTMRIINLPLAFIGSSISQVLLNKIADSDHTHPDRVLPLLINLTFKLLIFILPLVIICFLFGEELFIYVFGPNWAFAGSLAAPISIVIAIRFVVSPLSAVLTLDRNIKLAAAWQGLYFTSTVIILTVAAQIGFESFIKYFVINELIMYSIYYFLIIKGSLSYKHVN